MGDTRPPRPQAAGAHLLLEFHADGIGLLEEDGIAPQQVPQGRELVPPPLPEGPQRQLTLPLCPLDCGDTCKRSSQTQGLRVWGPNFTLTVQGAQEEGNCRKAGIWEPTLMPQRGRQLPQHEHKSSWSSARAGSTVTCSALWRQQWGRDGRADWGRPRTPSVDESRQGGGPRSHQHRGADQLPRGEEDVSSCLRPCSGPQEGKASQGGAQARALKGGPEVRSRDLVPEKSASLPQAEQDTCMGAPTLSVLLVLQAAPAGASSRLHRRVRATRALSRSSTASQILPPGDRPGTPRQRCQPADLPGVAWGPASSLRPLPSPRPGPAPLRPGQDPSPSSSGSSSSSFTSG